MSRVPQDVKDNVSRYVINNNLHTYDDWTHAVNLGLVDPTDTETAFARGLYTKKPYQTWKSRPSHNTYLKTLDPDQEAFMRGDGNQTAEALRRKNADALLRKNAAETQALARTNRFHLEAAERKRAEAQDTYNKNAATNALNVWVASQGKQGRPVQLYVWEAMGPVRDEESGEWVIQPPTSSWQWDPVPTKINDRPGQNRWMMNGKPIPFR